MRSQTVITFDFHNTIAEADAWFALEVRELPAAFLRWLFQESDCVPALDDDLLSSVADAYRKLRLQIANTGREQDAVSCLRAVLAPFGIGPPEAMVDAGVHVLMRDAFTNDVRAQPGAVETISDLADRGFTLGVISSAIYPPFLEWTLKRLGIYERFAMVLTSAEAGYYKSAPEIYHHAAARLDTAPHQIVHVGDSYRYDVEGARRAGFRTAWLALDRPTPDPSLADLTLPNLVDATVPLADLARWITKP